MKLIIQIPCYNEEATIRQTLLDLPTKIDGIDCIETLVVDDGSTDRTVEAAIDSGVDYVVKNKQNRGLSNSFAIGIETALNLGADIIVNTDGDNQYQGKYVKDLVKPIIEMKSEIVIGCRPIEEIEDFSPLKKKLQRIGSYVVCRLAGIDVPDTTSGFRAYTREAAMSMSVVSSFTYTLETIIQAGRRRIPMLTVPIKTNAKTRDSRLFNSSAQYVVRSVKDILLVSTQIRPIRTYGLIAGLSITIGVLLGFRFLLFYYLAEGQFYGESGHVQSLILAAIFLLFGSTSFLVGLIADQVGANRVLLEKIYSQSRMQQFNKEQSPGCLCNLVYSKNENLSAWIRSYGSDVSNGKLKDYSS